MKEVIEALKPFLQPLKPVLTPDMVITGDIVRWMRAQSNKSKLLPAFASCASNDWIKWKLQRICNSCGCDVDVIETNKSSVIEHCISPKKYEQANILCETCNKARQDSQKEANERQMIEETRRREHAFSLLERYMTSPWTKGEQLTPYNVCFNDSTYERIAVDTGLSYHEYIQSKHWKMISYNAMKKARFKCALCGCGGFLHTHHKNYDHLYMEANHYEDLIVLCSDCHSAYHKGKEL